jgi:hypothetical protein
MILAEPCNDTGHTGPFQSAFQKTFADNQSLSFKQSCADPRCRSLAKIIPPGPPDRRAFCSSVRGGGQACRRCRTSALKGSPGRSSVTQAESRGQTHKGALIFSKRGAMSNDQLYSYCWPSITGRNQSRRSEISANRSRHPPSPNPLKDRRSRGSHIHFLPLLMRSLQDWYSRP